MQSYFLRYHSSDLTLIFGTFNHDESDRENCTNSVIPQIYVMLWSPKVLVLGVQHVYTARLLWIPKNYVVCSVVYGGESSLHGKYIQPI